jgi:hypothetical protein
VTGAATRNPDGGATSASSQHDTWSELAVRENDGLAVSLLWSRATGGVKVAVVDVHLDAQFEIQVPSADALAAFQHPFAYAAGLDASFGLAGSPGGPHSTFERSTV